MSTFDEAIMRRLGLIDQIGTSATTHARQRSARMAQQRQISAPMQSYGGGGNQSRPNNQFEQFVAAISGQESGGNYGAVNRHSGALGRYQIMPGNIASWSKSALGRSVTPQQFLRDPKLQDQIARAQMQQYFNKWGPAGAAVAWYAGPGRVSSYFAGGGNKSQGSYPTIRQYVDQILRRMQR